MDTVINLLFIILSIYQLLLNVLLFINEILILFHVVEWMKLSSLILKVCLWIVMLFPNVSVLASQNQREKELIIPKSIRKLSHNTNTSNASSPSSISNSSESSNSVSLSKSSRNQTFHSLSSAEHEPLHSSTSTIPQDSQKIQHPHSNSLQPTQKHSSPSVKTPTTLNPTVSLVPSQKLSKQVQKTTVSSSQLKPISKSRSYTYAPSVTPSNHSNPNKSQLLQHCKLHDDNIFSLLDPSSTSNNSTSDSTTDSTSVKQPILSSSFGNSE